MTLKPLAVALCAAALILAACGQSTTSDGSGSTKISIRSAITPSGSLTGPYLYAIDHGFYKKANLEVEVSDGKGSLSVAKDVAQGNVDFGQVGSSTVGQSIDQGLPLISVAQQYGRGTYGVIVPEDSKIKSLEDLPGSTIVSSAGSPETLFIPAVLDKLGLDPKSVEILNVDAAVKGSTYASGKGDALGTTLPFFLPIVSPTRPSRGIPFDEAGITFPDYSIVVQPSYLKENASVVEKFLKASFEGFAAAAADPEGVGKSLKKHRPVVSDIDAQVQQFEEYQAFVCSDAQDGKPVGWHSPEAWMEGLDLFKKYGGIKGDTADLDRYFTNRFFDKSPVSTQTCNNGKAS